MKFSKKSVALAASAFLLSAAFAGSALAGGAAVRTAHLDAVDTGAAAADQAIDVALSLKVNDLDALKAFVASTVDINSPNYHQFLTPAQFADRYGQSAANIRLLQATLRAAGLQVTQVFNNRLVVMVRGTNAQFSSLFSTPIHTFNSPSANETFQRPTADITLPASLQGIVQAVHGLSTEAHFHPHSRVAALKPLQTATSRSSVASGRVTSPAAGTTPPTFHQPGTYTVSDLAAQNNINPLYAAGYNGAGTTIGIMTFASFTATDPTTYWAATGINHTGTITTVNVGGTIGTSGASETSLDIEQAGGVAPAANIIVYEAPNTDAGAIALYTRAVTDNIADTLSISWGESELFYGTADLTPYDAIFLQSAAQGVPISASSGDAGAYDVNGEGFPYPNYTATLDVDYPASSPYVLGAGGTTLPGTQTFALSNGSTASVTVPAERPWGWDYLQTVAEKSLGYTEAQYYANFFPVGGGGGVSVQYAVPAYQAGLAGVKTAAPGQLLFCMKALNSTQLNAGDQQCTVGTAFAGIAPMPAGFAGRNVPDVSMNADPETGYALYAVAATDGVNGWVSGYGGTSFVAPQLNGIFSLITQKLGHRVGWVHPQMYNAFKAQGYAAGSPFRALTTGTNEYWPATNSYNPATGLGALDAANLAAIFQ